MMQYILAIDSASRWNVIFALNHHKLLRNNKAQINETCIWLFCARGNKAEKRTNARRVAVQLTHKKLFNLEPETDYIAYVTAVTSAGAGPSQSVIAATRQHAR